MDEKDESFVSPGRMQMFTLRIGFAVPLALLLLALGAAGSPATACDPTELELIGTLTDETTLRIGVSNPTQDELVGHLLVTVTIEDDDLTFSVPLTISPGSVVLVQITFPDGFTLGNVELCGGDEPPPAINEAPDPIVVRTGKVA